jgi:5'-nucleotidase
MPLHVLLSNDDGILAPGLVAFHDALVAAGHRVTIVAPSGERSASSHAITIWKHMEARFIEREGKAWGWSIDATPADCVKLALGGLLDETPDVVVSGINPGPNIGDAIFYSGTVAAAAEGSFRGIPAMAVSLCAHYGDDRHFEGVARFAAKMVFKLAEGVLPPRVFLNVNAPNLPEKNIQGVVSTLQGVSSYVDNMAFKESRDDDAADLWRNEGKTMRLTPHEGDWDDRVIEQGFISVTPLRLDLTDHTLGLAVQGWLEDAFPGQVRHAAHVERKPSVEMWSPFPVMKPADGGPSKK